MPDLRRSEKQFFRDAIRSGEQTDRAARWEWLEGKWYPVWLLAVLGTAFFNARDAFTSRGLARVIHALLALFFGGLAGAILRAEFQAWRSRRRSGHDRASST